MKMTDRSTRWRPAAGSCSPIWPSIIDCAEDGDGTAVSVWSSAIGLVDMAPEMLAGMREGWSQGLDRLHELLAN